ncbi:PREDICTED: F-box/kelch-repeat protein At1g15670-like [Fragaria vesca subsp. vesca]|uniref:F-box/kelch-repeat protein At1g15670-like n=1 Tax=Fragaria vesca subsp. vesca TaxID=101020 RepID=UPI0002C31E6F|nr:PREDICTED: F-box/kelch-repeat protein At1g15670-like [Fragaria vesca subsp. vesca]
MESTELIPGFPQEIAYECLTRLHYSAHRVASRVCRRWGELIKSRDFYNHRKQSGLTHKAASLIQALPVRPGSKLAGPVVYGLSVFDPERGDWARVDPIPKYPEGLPLFCQVTSSEGKLVVMGGWDPASYQPVRDVFVYEFTTQRWSRGRDMPEVRSFFAAGEFDGRVYVAGGHDVNKNALRSARVYDVRANEWSELSGMSEERDECEGIVNGSEFWVVSGYGTDIQGGFVGSAEVYEIGSGRWRLVEDAWRASECPRSCVGIGMDGKLFFWGERDSAVKSGPCGVELGRWAFVSGSGYQGGPHEFFLTERENGKLKKVDVCEEFSGFVQSGCFVEI